MYENIPDELKGLPQWVGFLCEKLPNGRTTKKPVNVRTLYGASSTDKDTWSTFEQAVSAIGKNANVGGSQGKIEGIGFVFAPPYCGIDLDHVINAETGEINPQAVDIIDTMESYTEISPSGTGIHIIYKGRIHDNWKRKKNNALGTGSDIEMYQQGRFFTVTGITEHAYGVNDREACAELVYKAYMQKEKAQGGNDNKTTGSKPKPLTMDDKDILELARNSRNGMLFSELYSGNYQRYGSQSEADLAFCNMLAFWCRKDFNAMDRIFRQSGLMRDKWDRKQSGTTYGAITLNKAIDNCKNVYSPTVPKDDDFSVNIENSKSKSIKLYSFDDTGNAQRMADMFGEVAGFNYTDKKWMLYKETKWVYDESGYISKLMDRSLEAMKNEAEYYEKYDAENGTEMKKDFDKHYKKSRNHNTKIALEKEVRHYVPITHNYLDRHKMLLNTPSGVIDLYNFGIRKSTPKDYFTKSTNAEYIINAQCPAWIKFLNEIFDNDKNLIRYIQKAVGYSLTGSTEEQCVFFLYGSGKNGKSTFIDIIREMFGDYARNIQPETIMIRNNNAINSDIARLKGARFVTTVEPNEGLKLNEGLVKQLTGGDIITARKLYAEEFEFKPEFKLWMATNHKPVIRGTDLGIWRRVHMIPFKVIVAEENVDKKLTEKLLKELDGIFLWALEGLKMYHKEGLEMPSAVKQAVEEYKKEMDVVSRFLDECTKKSFSGSVKASELYHIYTEWCRNNGEYQMSNTKFGKEVSQKYQRNKKMDGWYYQGICFNEDSGPYSVTFEG